MVDSPRSLIDGDSFDLGFNFVSQSLILPTVVKHRLPSSLKSIPKFLATFRKILAAPFKSAFIKLPSALL